MIALLRHLHLPALVTSLIILASLPARAEQLTIFAAASLTNVISEAADQFAIKTGEKPVLSFASSSTLARQIEAGAPADIFLSANEKWLDYLQDKGLASREVENRSLSNQLVLIAPKQTNQKPLDQLSAKTIATLLGADGRIALGDPDHVPVGIYSKKALETLGLWAELEPRVARADNTRAALALVDRGECPLGITYRTDATMSHHVDILFSFPTELAPVRYGFALSTTNQNKQAQAFFDFITGPEGLALFKKYGFVVVGQ